MRSSDGRTIHDILLFYSENSPRCKSVKRYVDSVNIPVSLICVDSKAVRDNLSRLRNLRIYGVPTLAVVYSKQSGDTNILYEAEVFEGSEKTVAWLYQKFGSQDVSQNVPIQPQGGTYHPQDRPTERPTERPKVQKSVKHRDEKHEDRSAKSEPGDAKRKKIASIKALAKEMEEQRRKALNIDETGNTIRKAPKDEDEDRDSRPEGEYVDEDDDQ